MKKNPWTKKNEEIESLKRKLQEQRDKEWVKPFITSFLESLGTLLATKPYKDWPKEARIAFDWNARETPVLAEIYLSKLPK